MFFKRKKSEISERKQQEAEFTATTLISSLNNNEQKKEELKIITKRRYKNNKKRLTTREQEVLKRLGKIERILFSLAICNYMREPRIFSIAFNDDAKRDFWIRLITGGSKKKGC